MICGKHKIIMIRFEVCTNSCQSVRNAMEGGAQCAELCEALEVGGVTPSYGTLLKVSKIVEKSEHFDIRVLIRCRPGNYIYNDDQIDTMCEDIKMVKSLGYEGVVIGTLDENGELDVPAIKKMMAAGEGMKFTFHRAIDACKNPMKAMETLIGLGFDKVLTSGGKPNALAGIQMIAELQKRFGEKINIMAGGGVNLNNIKEILSKTGVRNCHASLTTVVENYHAELYPNQVDNTGAGMTWKVSNLQKIKEFVEIIKD